MDLDGSFFWYFGGALVLAALVISFIGIRGKASFPPSGPAMWGVTAVFGVLVAGACAYGVANASEEKEHRDHELAAEEAEAEEAVAEAPPASEQTAPSAPEGGTQELALTSPEDGSLVFDPDGLDAQPGAVTLAYDNPSPVPHNVAIEDEGGQLVAESDTISGDTASVNAELVPGEYTYFCSIPGHREGGMEGTLTVDADSGTAE